MGRIVCTLVLVTALAAGAPAAVAEEEAAQVLGLVQVDSPALVYADGALPGTVAIQGACLPDDPTLRIHGDRCAGPQTAKATMQHAVLGFDTAISSQGGDTDVPGLRDASGSRRTVTVTLNLREPGDVNVTLRAHEELGLSPTAVPGSASPAADTDAATVRWTLGHLQPGRYMLRAAYDLGSSADGWRFSPHVAVERHTHDDVLARHWRGEVRAGMPVSTVHRLVLQQRTGGNDTPTPSAPVWDTVDEGDTLAWTVEPGLTANGRWLPTDTAVSETQKLTIPDEVIAAKGLSSRGMAFTAMRPPGAAKDSLVYGLGWPDFSYHFTVGTPVPEADPWTQRPLTALYEGDATQSAIIADAGPSDRAGEQRPASGPQGRLVLQTNGAVTDAVATLAYTHVDGTDPNALDPESVRSACGDAALMSGVSGETFTLTAEGDIDNAAGTEPLVFAPLRVPHPPGFSRSTVLTLRGGDPVVLDAYDLEVTFTPTETVITPIVPAGQTFLASGTNEAGQRTWTAHPSLTIFYSRTRCPVTPTTGRVQSVPEGASAEMTLHAPDRAPQRAALGAGVWSASTTGGRLRVQRITR